MEEHTEITTWGQKDGVCISFVPENPSKIAEESRRFILLDRIGQEPLSKPEFIKASSFYLHLLKVTGISLERHYMKDVVVSMGHPRKLQIKFTEIKSQAELQQISSAIESILNQKSMNNPQEMSSFDMLQIAKALISQYSIKCNIVLSRKNFGIEVLDVQLSELTQFENITSNALHSLKFKDIDYLNGDVIWGLVLSSTDHNSERGFRIGFNTLTTLNKLLIFIKDWRTFKQLSDNVTKSVKLFTARTRELDTTQVITPVFGIEILHATERLLIKCIYDIPSIKVLNGKILL